MDQKFDTIVIGFGKAGKDAGGETGKAGRKSGAD